MLNTGHSPQTKLAVLEERLSSYELMMKRIDEAIQIMGQTNQNISKMLAVHEEKIDQCNRADILFTDLIHEVKDENTKQCNAVSKRIDKIEEELKEIGKIRWMTVGCGVVLAVLVTAFSTIASGWWKPFDVKPSTTHETTNLII